ncbi:MAG: T9SS type A sorting domain-containing protein [Lewinellaceae bacterium]|nr:T9SS type A sorting domain-containing protein [Lewinellaceae bacterium]
MAPKKAYYPISVVRTIPAMALLLLAFLVSSLPMRAQGWEKAFGGNKEDQGLAVIETIDRGYLVVGFSESFPNGADQDIDVYIIKTDVDGQMTWDTTFDIGFTEYGNAALQTADGGFLIAGEASFEGVQGPFKAYLLKITDRGKYQWSYTFDDAPGTSIRIKDVTASPDGGYLMVGFIEYPDANDDIFLLKVDDNGQEQWRKAFGIPGDDMATAVDVIGDGYVITGNEDNPFGVFDRDMIVYRLDGNGEVVWKRGMSTNEREVGNDVLVTHDGNIIVVGAVNDNADAALWKYGPNGNFILLKTKQMFGESDEANSVIELEDGSLVVAGFTEVSAINVDFMLIKYSQDGDDVNEVWATHTGDVATTDFVSDIAATSDGGYVLTGYNAQWLNIFNDIVLTRTDGEGNIYTNYIRGKVFYDQDEGCDLDNGEPPFSNWLVRASGPDRTFFGSTDQNGNYLIRVDTGDYVVEAIPANSYWESCSPNGVPLSLTNFYDTTLVHLPIKDKDIACPYLEVDISTPFLAACSDVTYTVDYENTGTTPADGAYVEVTLDDELTFVNASIPFTSLGENVYRFDLGSIPFNSEGAFTINTQMACSGIASGQAGLVEAHIFPDSLCTEPDPNWDGASIDVDGQCVNDTLRFKIENVGQGGMLMPRNFFVIEEDVMFLTKPFDLGSGQDTTILIPANGSTYRIIAEQSPGHPGNSYPTAAVEGCVTGAGTYSTGYVNDFPENDLDPFRSVQVDEVMENVGPVQLIAHPAGIQDSIISADIPLTYRYIFRNIGNDTVSRVIIRDTLPPGLDPGSIRPGASSHPYRFEVYFDGVVKLSFDDIQLPQDPTGNDPSSYGYAEFSIGQNPDNHVGTVIENTATVIFDYYAPMRTNTVRHYVGVDSLTRLVQVVSLDINGPEAPENLNIKVYPNPFVERATVEVTGWPSSGGPLEFTLFSQDGKLVHIARERANAFTVQRNALPAGTYFYSLRSEGKLLGSGTLIVR